MNRIFLFDTEGMYRVTEPGTLIKAHCIFTFRILDFNFIYFKSLNWKNYFSARRHKLQNREKKFILKLTNV